MFVRKNNYHQRGESIMAQGALPFPFQSRQIPFPWRPRTLRGGSLSCNKKSPGTDRGFFAETNDCFNQDCLAATVEAANAALPDKEPLLLPPPILMDWKSG